MDAILLQILNGLDKGSAYALIALGLTLIFGTLGVVNFAHGALFMIGAFCAVTLQRILNLSFETVDESQKDFLGNPLKVKTPYVESWFGPEVGGAIIDWAVPLAILFAIPIMIFVGYVMERGLIKHFYKREHADQILVTFGLAIVLQEIVKYFYGANPIQTPAPEALNGVVNLGAVIGMDIVYPVWRVVYFFFAVVIIGGIFSFLQFTTFGMVVRAGMADRETVGLLGINIDRRFTIMFGIAAAVAGLAGVMYTPINSPNYHMGMDFLVLSFVVVVVGGMGSLPGAVLAGFLLGVLESFASMNEIKSILPGIDQIIIYVVAIIILLTRPRGLMGRKGVMED
ncbi:MULTISPECIES: branched-chain amino acid ABC transporter permease [Rhodobacterales]|jgi:branched-subunit amino acid ABC-type transport system permease component|uniref:Amino acid/amide ABC transporter membrane protein 1, HAAT family n=1 Tax=Phaeobacter gallaeciensis TaxID=60890 RepID=A0A1B0ZML8_9RHOB|nr:MULTISPECIES: branched-chain amino acid ABC transporter permease [Phaeobacter]MDF1771163.1 branched-chain amino acid ABC transporter permease [Pseudophaeobacter sp. bin_em_oilr2.035]MEE2634314.1 branched-chain amino acid ABC transporter permease [Pseudomonadota bacterium]ANP35416.1 amino acid/amide ABC transporter membrane protein 1, HAAT family [Phaeobacter gallaeciensis]MDE4062038.1 branched-chain amino acid ABC transporter permease [Phaeobacter gallaeciensis]MDE4099042.1 branched-chain a